MPLVQSQSCRYFCFCECCLPIRFGRKSYIPLPRQNVFDWRAEIEVWRVDKFVWDSIPELEKMIADGEITDGFTIAAYTKAKLKGLI
jgi:hypothetical protein